MKIIIPMAGLGERFVRSGYKDPKPLIEVSGKKIIEYILSMFDKNDDYVFVCNQIHIETTEIVSVLKKLVPKCEIISVPQHKKGPVFTVKHAFEYINDEEEVIISYCDNAFIWDRNDFQKKIIDVDGCILTHSGFHPHTLSSTKMAFTKVNGDLVEEIKEKESYTDTPMNEHASTGVYYFKKGSYVKKYFNSLMENDINYNGEFYVTLVYNLLIRDGLKITFYDTPFVTVLGTPEEVENFNSWNVIINEKQIKNRDDLLKTYEYWRKYKEITSNIPQG